MEILDSITRIYIVLCLRGYLYPLKFIITRFLSGEKNPSTIFKSRETFLRRAVQKSGISILK